MTAPTFPVLSELNRRPEDFEWPRPTTLDKLKRYFAFALAAPKIKGVDLAPDYQRDKIISVQAMRDAGYLFAFVQVNRGLWVHPNLMAFCAPLFDAGFPILTYALFYGTISGEEQADFHLNNAYQIWQRQGMKLPAMLDIELRDGVSVGTRVTHTEDWFRIVREEVEPVKYCSPSLNNELLGGYPLGSVIGHVAHWTSAIEPATPTGWTKEKTRFWQYGVATKYPWCPAVPGTTGAIDVDYFFGTHEELIALDRGVSYNSASASASPSAEPEEDEEMATILEKIKTIKDAYPETTIAINVNFVEGTVEPPPDDGGDDGGTSPVRYRVDTTGKPNNQVKVRPTPDEAVGQLYFVFHGNIVGGPGRTENEFFYIEEIDGKPATPPGWVELQWLVKL